MYSKASIPGSSREGSITVTLNTFTLPSKINVLIYNYKDSILVNPNEYIIPEKCTEASITAKKCIQADLGKFLIDTTKGSQITNILNEFWDLKETKIGLNFTYTISDVGYYCLFMASESSSDFDATAEFVNPFGLLPAIEYPKLPVLIY